MLPSSKPPLILLLLTVVFWFVCSLARGDVFWPQPKREVWGEGGLRRELWVSQERASVGESIDLVFTVKNVGDETEVIEIDDGPVMDILVGQGDHYEQEVYWSDGREITPEMRRLELAPGESKTIEMAWVPIGRTDGADASDAIASGIFYMKKKPSGEWERFPVHIIFCVGMCDWLI